MVVPDPGQGSTGGEWTDVEPNNTPGTATPVGPVQGAPWLGFTQPYTQINSNTDVDYYSFKTTTSLDFDISFCWSAPVDLLDLSLYAVVNSQKGPLLKAAATNSTSCENLIAFGERSPDGGPFFQPDASYLLEVRAAPGLILPGDGGPVTYMA
jgi:hypothetical protein